MIRVAIVDDHPMIRTGLCAVLGTHDDLVVVGATGDPDAVPGLVVDTAPDVVVLDVGLGDRSGLDLIPTLSAEARVVVFSATATDRAVLSALGAGATGYLLKDATSDEVAAAIRTAAAGTSVLAPSVAAKVVGRAQHPDSVLSRRELDVLAALADGLTNRQVASRLFMSESTVKTHLIRVFTKLGVSNRAGAVREAGRRGLVDLD